jgi:serine/threonine-protein kinase RsbW
MPTQSTRAPEAITFERVHPGTVDQPRVVRANLAEIAGRSPIIDALELLASELAANAVSHSRSGDPGGMFTVRATLYRGDYAWVEVIDEGGPWAAGEDDEEHGRGLAVVAAVAGDGNWGIEGDSSCRVAWFRLDWPQR